MTMTMHRLARATPNEKWEMVLEFEGPEFRLLDTAVIRRERGWSQLAYPQHVKRFLLRPDAIEWPAGGRVDAEELHEKSRAVAPMELEQQVLRIGYKNQAPTPEDASHHVYGVYLARYSSEQFRVGESIGGGIADRGGGRALSLAALLAWDGWQRHFDLSGCTWAAALVDSMARDPVGLFDALVDEACIRNGMDESG
jgi:hypothetical protein